MLIYGPSNALYNVQYLPQNIQEVFLQNIHTPHCEDSGL